MLSGASVPQALVPLFLQAAARYGIPPQLLAAVGRVESNFNPNAVSSAGAQGLMQIMPDTAKGLKLADAFDPTANIDAGSRYLKAQLAAFGDVRLALAAYNAGPRRVQEAGGMVPDIGQTRDFVSQVQALKGDFRQRFRTVSRR